MAELRILCTGGSGFIGSHFLSSKLSNPSIQLLNVDVVEPRDPELRRHSKTINILERAALESVYAVFEPTHIVHLAAKADMEGRSLLDYPENVQGTKNVLDLAAKLKSLEHVIVASTQHVRKPGSGPARNDEDFAPYGAYGQSKVMTERLTRESTLQCKWTIVRPTAIWGPYHFGLARGLWRIIAKGLYLHPRNDAVVRSYGYVKNVAHQIDSIMRAPRELVDRQVFYLGDPCIRQMDWVDAFSVAITARHVRTAPTWLLLCIACMGSILHRAQIRVPLYMERYRNLTTNNPVPTERTANVLGSGPYSLEDGIDETVRWLRAEKLV